MKAKKMFIFAVALFLSTAMFAAQREVMIQKSFNSWSEATQRDTTLTFVVKYGKVLYNHPLKFQGLDLLLSQGNPHIQALSASFLYPIDITATAPEKFLGHKMTRKFEKVNVESQIYHIRDNFVKAKEYFEKWSKVAKDEHVTNYHKAVTDQYIYDIPCIFRCSSDGNTFFYSTWGSQKDVLKMEFVVDSLGNCKLYWGIPNNQTPTFYRQQVEAQYGGLVKKDVTRTYKISAAKAGLWFTSAEKIQSLIDALDPKALEKECKALYEEKNRKDNRDELFK